MTLEEKKDEIIHAHIEAGLIPFRIKRIDTYRDGGTLGIMTTKDEEYCMGRITNELYRGYPASDNQIPIDDPLIPYLKLQLQEFITTQVNTINNVKNILKHL